MTSPAFSIHADIRLDTMVCDKRVSFIEQLIDGMESCMWPFHQFYSSTGSILSWIVNHFSEILPANIHKNNQMQQNQIHYLRIYQFTYEIPRCLPVFKTTNAFQEGANCNTYYLHIRAFFIFFPSAATQAWWVPDSWRAMADLFFTGQIQMLLLENTKHYKGKL